MELYERKQLLDCIKSEIQLYDGYEDMSSEAYDKQRDVENQVNRKLRRLIGQDDLVSKADSFVGKTVWYSAHGIAKDSDVYIILVERVRFMKWKVEFIGKGMRVCHDTDVYTWSSFEIDNSDFKEAMENDWIVVAGEHIDELIKKVEHERDEKIRLTVEKINDEYDDIIAKLKQVGSSDAEPEEHPHKLSVWSTSGSHEDRIMDHICQYSWSDIVRSFGSDEDKAEIGPEPVDEMADEIVEDADES